MFREVAFCEDWMQHPVKVVPIGPGRRYFPGFEAL
jgi:hypothetical protein